MQGAVDDAQCDSIVISIGGVPFEMHVPASIEWAAQRYFAPYRSSAAPKFTVTPEDDPGYAEYVRGFIPQISDAELCLDELMHGAAEKMLDYDCLFFHAAVIAVGGKAYAFTAPSGTGKSTHISLWKRHFGDKAVIVNGDKPFLRRCKDGWYACASPWAGKENWQTRIDVPLGGLCFIERGRENTIRPISDVEVVNRIVVQIDPAIDAERAGRQLELIDRLIAEVPCYLLACNISDEAARLSYETMSGRKDWDEGQE